MDATETDNASLVGDVAHIVGESQDGPRGESPLSLAERNRAANLLLLCKIHHKQVDDQPGEYTVDRLRQFKAAHETWVRSSLALFDDALQRDKEVYASYVEQWEERSRVDEWEGWTEGLLSMDQPSLLAEDDARITELRKWLFSRVWPNRYADLEDAFENFRAVLSDLHETFRLHIERHGDTLWTRKFYRIDQWNPELYHRLGDQYEHHVDVVQDLVLELTRAANLVCDMVRRRIDPAYRMESGLITVIRGADLSLKAKRLRPQYRIEERSNRPYPGLARFEIERATRDIHIGNGSGPQ